MGNLILSALNITLYVKNKYMNKTTILFLIIWSILAIAAFVSSFWAPLVVEIFNLTFGGINMLVILTWLFGWISFKLEERKLNKLIDESNKLLDKELEDGM